MNLPYITKQIPGIGGEIKSSPEDFQVNEIPLYTASNEGQHLFITLKRKGLNTKDVVIKLQNLFDISEKDIGYAGLKDKNALTTQVFSLSLGANYSIEDAKEKLKSEPDLIIENIERHINKIKTGHLLGNRFKIKVKGVSEDAFETATKVKDIIINTGIPNYYGPQRFGTKQDNWKKGIEILKGERKEKKQWLKKLYLSSMQSFFFNDWLKQRIEGQNFDKLISDDILLSTGGSRTFPYSSDTEKDHEAEFQSGQLSYTGPMFGHKLRWPNDTMKNEELKIIEKHELCFDDLKNKFLMGTRRAAVLHLEDLNITKELDSLWFEFTLPAGSYATVVLREFMKNESIDQA